MNYINRHEAVLLAIPVGLVVLATWALWTPTRDTAVLAAGLLVLAILVGYGLFARPPQ